MQWIIGAAILFIATGILAWFYPNLKSRISASRRSRSFRQLAAELGGEISTDVLPETLGFMSTVHSVFGPYGSIRNLVLQKRGTESLYLFEYFFGHSRWSVRRGITIAAFHLERALPLLTLKRPRDPPKSRSTEFRAGGQRLVIQAIGEFELWSTEREKKQARKHVTSKLLEILRGSRGWDVRGVDRWLIVFKDEGRRQTTSPRVFRDQALQIRSALDASKSKKS